MNKPLTPDTEYPLTGDPVEFDLPLHIRRVQAPGLGINKDSNRVEYRLMAGDETILNVHASCWQYPGEVIEDMFTIMVKKGIRSVL